MISVLAHIALLLLLIICVVFLAAVIIGAAILAGLWIYAFASEFWYDYTKPNQGSEYEIDGRGLKEKK